jgi:GNAT superfamily N-acetyltransferase
VRGYTRGYAWMKFARNLGPVQADSSLRAVEIGADAAAVFGDVVATAFAMPPWVSEWVARLPGRSGWTCVLAYAGERPAGAGALYVAGGVGWLGFGAVLPECRGRGGQALLLAARIDAARARGCALLATETGVRTEGEASASYRNILRAGFVEAGARDNWVPPSTASR